MAKYAVASLVAVGSLAGASLAQAEPVSLTPDQADDVVAGLTLFLGGFASGGRGGFGGGGGSSATASGSGSTCSGTCTFGSASAAEASGFGGGSGGDGGFGFGGLFVTDIFDD
jgi:hypothetical protein